MTRMNWNRAKRDQRREMSDAEFDAMLERQANRFLAQTRVPAMREREVGGKPWLQKAGGARLDAFLGSRGLKTSLISTTEELIAIAGRVYELPLEATPRAMADRIAGLGMRARRALAAKNLPAAKAELGEKSGRARHVETKARPAVTVTDDVDLAKLLHQVVMAVINAGQADLLNALPDVLAYYGSTLPTVADVVGKLPERHEITGGIMLDDIVYHFRVSRPGSAASDFVGMNNSVDSHH